MVAIAVQRMDTDHLLGARWPRYGVPIPRVGCGGEEDGVLCGGVRERVVNDRLEFREAEGHGDDVYFPHVCGVFNGLQLCEHQHVISETRSSMWYLLPRR